MRAAIIQPSLPNRTVGFYHGRLGYSPSEDQGQSSNQQANTISVAGDERLGNLPLGENHTLLILAEYPTIHIVAFFPDNSTVLVKLVK